MRNITDIFETKNVASLLDKTELEKISEDSVNGFDSDDESRSEWKERNKEGMKLAMQIYEQKDFPHEKAANVKYPLLSVASIQFASRAYPNLIPGWDIVKGKVIGDDPQGLKATASSRVETHMNYQLNEEMDEWEEETDKLLTVIPILGCCFKKTYYSSVNKRNMSVFCNPTDIVMNYRAKSMTTVPRITEKYNLYPNEIIERIRSDMFLDFEFGDPVKTKDEEDRYSSDDDFRPHLFLEQHTWLDLDGDGYKEPYILNVHYDTKKVVRIYPRFQPKDIEKKKDKIIRIKDKRYYTKFSFMPSPDGSIYDWGFGSLLSPINETVNTSINQLLDAGTISNCQGGFLGKGINLGRGRSGGAIRLKINEWLPVGHSGDDLRKNIVPLPKTEPSAVLFSLLGFMVTAGEKLSSVTELMMGEQTVHNEPATTSLARMEQGMKVFSAIHKRLHRAFSKEFKLLYQLNSEYLPLEYYFKILDRPEINNKILQSDYNSESCDIIPTASPEDVTNTQKLIKAQALMAILGQGFNDMEIKRRYIEALQIPDIEPILKTQEPPPDPKLVLESEKIDLERSKFEFEMMKFGYEMGKIQSEIIKNLAEAESKEIGQQLDQYKAQMQNLVSLVSKSQTKGKTADGKPQPVDKNQQAMMDEAKQVIMNPGAMSGNNAE